MPTFLDNLAPAYVDGNPFSLYSVCSAHPLVLKAAVDQALADQSPLLVEATSNQVNQFGGYTGMRPAAFRDFVFGTLQSIFHATYCNAFQVRQSS